MSTNRGGRKNRPKIVRSLRFRGHYLDLSDIYPDNQGISFAAGIQDWWTGDSFEKAGGLLPLREILRLYATKSPWTSTLSRNDEKEDEL